MSKKGNLGVQLQLMATRNNNNNLLIAFLFLDIVTQNNIYIQWHNNMDLS